MIKKILAAIALVVGAGGGVAYADHLTHDGRPTISHMSGSKKVGFTIEYSNGVKTRTTPQRIEVRDCKTLKEYSARVECVYGVRQINEAHAVMKKTLKSIR
jgi:hypothetical protein